MSKSDNRTCVWVLVFGGYPSTLVNTIEVGGETLDEALGGADRIARAERDKGFAAVIERWRVNLPGCR